MITKFKLFELYRGPYKAAGFKHYQESGFALLVMTTKEGIEDFTEIHKTFITHLKRLGCEPDIIAEDITNTLIFAFPAVNQYEAMSIIDQINTYFINKKIPIIRASMTPEMAEDTPPEKLLSKAVDLTSYLKRKEDIKQKVSPAHASFMDRAYKNSVIGF